MPTGHLKAYFIALAFALEQAVPSLQDALLRKNHPLIGRFAVQFVSVKVGLDCRQLPFQFDEFIGVEL